jgi:hypothetical protein
VPNPESGRFCQAYLTTPLPAQLFVTLENSPAEAAADQPLSRLNPSYLAA